MDRNMANEPRFIQGHLGVVRSIASGESLVTFDHIASISDGPEKSGFGCTPSLFRKTIRCRSGRTLQRFSKQRRIRTPQNFFSPGTSRPSSRPKQGTGRPRSDVPARTDGSHPHYNVVTTTANSSPNTIQLADLRKRFEVYTGPVKNTGGVR